MRKIVILNYDMTGGDHVFDPIYLEDVVTSLSIQVEYEDMSANDATLEFLQSLDKKNFDTIVDSAGKSAIVTLDGSNSAKTATLNIYGFKISLIKPILLKNAVNTGIIKTITILY